MKIAYISSSVVPSRAANSVHVMKMCQAFAAAGHEVELLTLEGRDVEIDVDDVYEHYGVAPVFRIRELPWPRTPGRAFLSGYAAAIGARQGGADHAHGRFLHGCVFAAFLGIPVTFEVHATIPDGVQRALFDVLIRHPAFRGLVAISGALRERFVTDFPVLRDRVLVAHDGADPVGEHRGTFARHAGLNVGYIGSFYRGRGLEMILDLAARCPYAHFHLAGGDKAALLAERSDNELPRNVTIYGFIPPSRAEGLRLSCDVLLAPYQRSVSVFGGGSLDTAAWMSPLKIFEDMAAGKAIVASRLPVLEEVLTHGENALLCGPEDVDEWQAAIDRLSQDRHLRMELGGAAERTFQRHYTWRSRAEAIVELAGEPGTRPAASRPAAVAR